MAQFSAQTPNGMAVQQLETIIITKVKNRGIILPMPRWAWKALTHRPWLD